MEPKKLTLLRPHQLAALRQIKLGKNPVFNPAARAGIPAELHGALDAIAAAGSEAADRGLSLTVQASDGSDVDLTTMFGPDSVWGGWDQHGFNSLNPVSNARRLRPFPVKMLVQNATTTAAGAATLTFTPQEDFQAFRLCFPSSSFTALATFTNLLVGDQLMTTTTAALSCALFDERSDGGYIDFPKLRAALSISMTIAGGGAAKEISAALLGYALGRKRVINREIEGMKLIGIPTQTITHGAAAAAVNIVPQSDGVIRRIGIDDTQTNWASASMYCQGITIGDVPQLVGSAAEFPFQMFRSVAEFSWVDFDPHTAGQTVSLTAINRDALNDIALVGMYTVDVFRKAA